MSTATYEYKVNAPLNSVWSVLSDVHHYDDWNPFIVRAAGTLTPGTELDMVCVFDEEKDLRGPAMVTSYEHRRRFSWEIRSGLKTWEARIEAHSPSEDVTDVSVVTSTKGVPLLARGPGMDQLEDGFNRMMEALKERVKEITPAV